MAALTFTDLQTRCANMLRLSTSSTAQMTQLGYIMNEVYRDILARNPTWWFLQKRAAFNTATAVQGTATVAYGSETVVLSTAPATGEGSFEGRAMLVRNATDNAVYRVLSHATGSGSFTLDAPYVSTSTDSASLTIYKDRYDTPADFGRPRYLTRFGSSQRVQAIGPDEMAALKQSDTSEGAPAAVTLEDFFTTGDSTSRRQLVIHPWPDVPYRLELAYQRTANTEVSGETRFLIPDEYSQILIYGTLARAYPAMMDDMDRGQIYERLFNDLLAMLVATQRKWEGLPRMQPVDYYRGFYARGRRVSPGSADLGGAFDRWPLI